MGFGWSSFGTPYRYSVHHLFQRSPHLRRAGAAAAVFAAMSLLAGCSASQAPVTDTASATPVVGSVSAMGAAQFTQRLAAYERKHNLHIRVDAIDTGNGRHLGWRGEETGPFTMTGLTAAVLVLERASDDELAATVSTASPIAGAAQQQMPDPTLLDAISSALQADDGPAQQALINWLGGESDFRAAATALLRSSDGTMTAESLASVMNAAVYGTATLAPDRRSTLRNLLLNNSAASATASGTDAPWEVATVRVREDAGTLIEVSTLEVPYREYDDAAPLVLAVVVNNADSPRTADNAAREVAQLVTRALPPSR